MTRNGFSGGRSLEVLGSNHTAAERLFSSWLWGPNNFFPGTCRFLSTNKELLSNWLGGKVIPLQEIQRGFLFLYLLNCLGNCIPFFLSRNFLIVFLFSVYGIFNIFFISPKRKNNNFVAI